MSARLSLSISILFAGVPLLDRVGMAARSGYRILESWWPWPAVVADKDDVDKFVATFALEGARLHLLNLCEGDLAHGGRGLAGVPEAEDDFWANARAAIELGTALGTSYLNVLAGNIGHQGRAVGLEVLERRLAALGDLAAAAGIGLVVEQLNPHDHPAYLLTDPAEAIALIHRVRLRTGGEIGMLADVYHLARSGVDPVGFVEQHVGDIRHVQLADYPGRGKPGTGGIDIARVLQSLELNGYEGIVGLEYIPGPDDPEQLAVPEQLWRELAGPQGGG